MLAVRLISFRIPKRRAKFAGFESGLLAKETAEVCGVVEPQVAGDLLDVELGIRQLTLCFANDSLVDDRSR